MTDPYLQGLERDEEPVMATAVAVGATPTSQEVSGLGEAALFSRLRKTSLGLCVSNG